MLGVTDWETGIELTITMTNPLLVTVCRVAIPGVVVVNEVKVVVP